MLLTCNSCVLGSTQLFSRAGVLPNNTCTERNVYRAAMLPQIKTGVEAGCHGYLCAISSRICIMNFPRPFLRTSFSS